MNIVRLSAYLGVCTYSSPFNLCNTVMVDDWGGASQNMKILLNHLLSNRDILKFKYSNIQGRESGGRGD